MHTHTLTHTLNFVEKQIERNKKSSMLLLLLLAMMVKVVFLSYFHFNSFCMHVFYSFTHQQRNRRAKEEEEVEKKIKHTLIHLHTLVTQNTAQSSAKICSFSLKMIIICILFFCFMHTHSLQMEFYKIFATLHTDRNVCIAILRLWQ